MRAFSCIGLACIEDALEFGWVCARQVSNAGWRVLVGVLGCKTCVCLCQVSIAGLCVCLFMCRQVCVK